MLRPWPSGFAVLQLSSPDSIMLYVLKFGQEKKDLSSWVKIVITLRSSPSPRAQ